MHIRSLRRERGHTAMVAIRIVILLGLLGTALTDTSKQSADAKQQLEDYIEDASARVNQRYRLTYHIAAPVGWINDPNGFSYYRGQYHLFYQFYPYDSVWGPMHWGHVVSRDLVTWERLPTALLPDDEQCFSGSAVVNDSTLVLMYTGHHVTGPDEYYQSQYIALSEDGVNFEKFEGNPVIPAEPDRSPDFRDPKVWRHGGWWYVIVGSMTSDDRGRVLLYRSGDLIQWEFLTVLAESDGTLGYMWECPDFFELDGKHVLLMSPQGIEQQGDRFKNLHQTGYIVGSFNYTTYEFVPEAEFQELDFGHDFYAAQTTEVNGRRLLVAWFDMWESYFPEKTDSWSGALTMIREIHLDTNNRITMNPVEETTKLRNQTIFNGSIEHNSWIGLSKAAELIISSDMSQNLELEFFGLDGGINITVAWDPDTNKVKVEKGDGDARQVEWTSRKIDALRIFLDTSSLELYCGEGEVVFSSRSYPAGGWGLRNRSLQKVKMTAYSLKRGVPV